MARVGREPNVKACFGTKAIWVLKKKSLRGKKLLKVKCRDDNQLNNMVFLCGF